MKQGPLSRHEKKFIEDNLRNLTYLEISAKLDRKPETIEKYITGLGFAVSLAVDVEKDKQAVQAFKSREFYPELTKQFTAAELIEFERLFSKMEEQFGELYATEEGQLLDLVKTTLLMDRSLKTQMAIQTKIKENEELKKKELDKGAAANRAIIENYNREINGDRLSLKHFTEDYKVLATRKDKLLIDIKGSRGQRIKEIEQRSESFGALIKALVADKDFNREAGIETEKMRLAMIDEQVRLAAYLKYEDGKIDQPLLTPDTVKEDNTP